MKHDPLPHLLEAEPLPDPSALEDLAHPLLREPVVRHAGVRVHVVVPVREEVDDEEDAAGPEARCELARREVRVAEVVEAQAHGREVEGLEVRGREGGGRGVGGIQEIAGVGMHLIGSQTLGGGWVSVNRTIRVPWRGCKRTLAYLVLGTLVIRRDHLLREVDTDALRGVGRKGLQVSSDPVSLYFLF